jgi:type I restriction enzyme R subunit
MAQPLSFKPFNEAGEVRTYYHHALPHWRQVGCTYFVTFRLADSVPQAVLNEWKHDRDSWLRARNIDPDSTDWHARLSSLTRHDHALFERRFSESLSELLDKGHGSCVLRDPTIRQVATDALRYFHPHRVEIGDFVVMPNHVHALMTPGHEFELEDILQSIKSFTAKQINGKLGRAGNLWMHESYDHIVRDYEDLMRIQAYIRANPSQAGLKEDEYSLQTAEYRFSG